MMFGMLALLSGFITTSQDTYNLNITLLVIVFVLLIIALSICILILNKNNLYSKQNYRNNPINMNTENEVA